MRNEIQNIGGFRTSVIVCARISVSHFRNGMIDWSNASRRQTAASLARSPDRPAYSRPGDRRPDLHRQGADWLGLRTRATRRLSYTLAN